MSTSTTTEHGPGSGPEPAPGPSLPDNSETNKKPKLYFGHPREKLSTIVIFALVNLLSSTISSLQAPFYPREAESKGASATEYGLVLGIFNLVMFLTSPIFGVVLGIANPRLVFNVGIFITAIGTIAFGFIDYFPDHSTFIALSFILRILQATGDAAFVTASFTILAIQFPESVATTFATLETFWGLGMLIGPGLGGVLYQFGGFILPFLVTGVAFLIIGIITYFILPDVSGPLSRSDDDLNIIKKTGMVSMMRIPEVSLAFFSVVIAASSVGFLISTLEPHLRLNFGLTPATTGLVFMIDGGMYAIFAPLWGRLCDKHKQPKIFLITGALLTFAGFLLIGPAPFIPLPTMLWLTCIGLVIHGLGTGASYVSCFIQALRGSVSNGMADDVSTYGLVSGLFISSLCLGVSIGSSFGGVLLDFFGFRMSSFYVFGTQLLVVILNVIFICTPKKGQNQLNPSGPGGDSETQSLLQNESVKSYYSEDPIDNSLNLRKTSNSKSKLKGADYGAV